MAQDIPNTDAPHVAIIAATFRLMEDTYTYSDADFETRRQLFIDTYEALSALYEKGPAEARARLEASSSD